MENNSLEESFEDRKTPVFDAALQKSFIEQTLPGNRLNFVNKAFFQIPAALILAIILYYVFSIISASLNIILQ